MARQAKLQGQDKCMHCDRDEQSASQALLDLFGYRMFSLVWIQIHAAGLINSSGFAQAYGKDYRMAKMRNVLYHLYGSKKCFSIINSSPKLAG